MPHLCDVLILALMGYLATPRVSIRVNPLVIMAREAMRVVCTVPKDAQNRGLTISVENYSSSFEQLDGDQSRVTHERLISHMPCDAGDVGCRLQTSGKPDAVAIQSIVIAGCNQ